MDFLFQLIQEAYSKKQSTIKRTRQFQSILTKKKGVITRTKQFQSIQTKKKGVIPSVGLTVTERLPAGEAGSRGVSQIEAEGSMHVTLIDMRYKYHSNVGFKF